MTTKEDKKIKKAVALAKKKQSEFFDDESEIELKAFREAMKKEFGVDEEVIKKPSKRIQLKKPIIVCSDSEDESPITNQEPIINCNVDMPEAIIDETEETKVPPFLSKPSIIPVFELASHMESINKSVKLESINKPVEVKSIFQEAREHEGLKPSIDDSNPKLISVKKAPYDLKQSNNDKVKIDTLNTKLVEMQKKYNDLMKKYNVRGEELTQLKKENQEQKKYKVCYDMVHNKKNSIKNYIETTYTITDDSKDYIKCCDVFEHYCNSDLCDKSISQIAFNKQMELLRILKSKKTGYNCFYGIRINELTS